MLNRVKKVLKNKGGYITYWNSLFAMFEVEKMKNFEIQWILHFKSVNMNTSTSWPQSNGTQCTLL